MRSIKKVFIILFSLGILIFSSCSRENVITSTEGFYAYSTSVKGFDEYAKDDFANHAFCYYGFVDDSLNLGKGIYIYGKEYPTVIYPVWKNDIIVGTFNVFLYDGEYSGSYSDGNVVQLNHAKGISSYENPLKLLQTDLGLYYSIGGDVYQMGCDEIKEVKGFGVKIEFFTSFVLENGKIINVEESLEYNPIILQ